MADDDVTRKLAAILAADMAGYSRLMEADEAGTIERLRKYRDGLIQPKVEAHAGRIVKTTGDGFLAEFASVVDAVECAVAIQRQMATQESDEPADRRIRLRIGINLGDVVVDGDDLLGDGVNIASRLETTAEPGGICVSEAVVKQVRNKVGHRFLKLGAKKLKNLAEPVVVYEITTDRDQEASRPRHPAGTGGRSRRRAAGLVAASVLIAVALGLSWWHPWTPSIEPARADKMAFPLPDKPSIAVLPFANLSGDRSQDYLADGLSENIIQALSKISDIFVIARSSTFTYKGRPVKVQRVAEEMGVRYVLEGSLQKSGDRVRVTAQLIDATTGHHLWSGRYDRKLGDLFAVQDEITQRIVVGLQVKLTDGEQARVRHRSTDNLEAWGYVVRGLARFRRFTKTDNARARELFKLAIKTDPQYATAWTMRAWTHWYDARFGWSNSRATSIQRAAAFTKKALALGPDEPAAHTLMGALHLAAREYDQAVAEGRKALELGPNLTEINAIVAITMRYVGNWPEAIRLGERAARLGPRVRTFILWNLGLAYTFNGDRDRAVAAYTAGLSRARSDTMRAQLHLGLAYAHSESGRIESARRHMASALKLNPRHSARYIRRTTFFKDPAHLERMLTALRAAGLPE